MKQHINTMKSVDQIKRVIILLFSLIINESDGHWSHGFMHRHPHHMAHHGHQIRMNTLTGPNFRFRYSLDTLYESSMYEAVCTKSDKATLNSMLQDHLCMINQTTDEAEMKLLQECFNMVTEKSLQFPRTEETFKSFICSDKNALKKRSIAELCFLRGLIFNLNETTEKLVKFEPCFTNYFEGYGPSMLEPYAMMADLNEAINKLQDDGQNLCSKQHNNLILQHECSAREARNKLQPELCGEKKSEEKITQWIKLTSCLTCGDNNCNIKDSIDLTRLKDCWLKYTTVNYPTNREEFMKYSCESFDNAYEKSHLTFKCFAGQTLKHTPNKTPQERIAIIHDFAQCFAEKNPLANEINPILKDRYVTEGLILINKRKQSVNKWKSNHCTGEDKIDPNGLLTKIEETVKCLQVNTTDIDKQLLSSCWRGLSKQEVPVDRKQWKDWACSLSDPVTKIKIIRNCYFNIRGGFHSLPIFLHRHYRENSEKGKEGGEKEKATNEMPTLTASQEELVKKVHQLYDCLMKHDIDPDML